MKKFITGTFALIVIIFLSNTLKAQDFDTFAKDFIDNGTSGLAAFKNYTEKKIQTTDENMNNVKVKPAAAFDYLKYFFGYKIYTIENKIIKMTDGEFEISTYFRQNRNGEWKLYKYDTIM